ncbi:hypothetical protein K402DRAFT_450780 [Aulographum hederae CBS 113979]|uniref:BZIP domain-containing protein n=1 Tax=Aulographum hederae CBS 113979 TaxID=1176131 RepID=A0A6G1HDP9_9PEZI|nr:hypothetical protein K402DRAFT_450780 [Aulographum hederae CBS 113979]
MREPLKEAVAFGAGRGPGQDRVVAVHHTGKNVWSGYRLRKPQYSHLFDIKLALPDERDLLSSQQPATSNQQPASSFQIDTVNQQCMLLVACRGHRLRVLQAKDQGPTSVIRPHSIGQTRVFSSSPRCTLRSPIMLPQKQQEQQPLPPRPKPLLAPLGSLPHSTASSPPGTLPASPYGIASAYASPQPSPLPHLTSFNESSFSVAASDSSTASGLRLSTDFGAALAPTSGPTGNGPASSAYQVPPRPKPGRKPAIEEPESKRKQQNRDAQRAFRSRKQQQKEESESAINKLRQTNVHLQNQVVRLQQEGEQVRRNLAIVSAESAQWQAKAKMLEQRLLTLNNNNNNNNPFYNNQRDTWDGISSTPVTYSQTPASTRPSTRKYGHMTPPSPLPTTETCGGCKADGQCPCVDEYTNVPPDSGRSNVSNPPNLTRSMSIESVLSPSTENPPASTFKGNSLKKNISNDSLDGFNVFDLETDFTTRPSVATVNSSEVSPSTQAPAQLLPTTTSMPPPAIPPGTCNECQRNPEQRNFCLELSARKQAGSISIDSVTGETTEEPPAKKQRTDSKEESKTLNCQEAYHLSKSYAAVNAQTPRTFSTVSQQAFSEFIDSQPQSRRPTIVGSLQQQGQQQQLPRTFSLVEYDVLDVLCQMRKSFSVTELKRADSAVADEKGEDCVASGRAS